MPTTFLNISLAINSDLPLDELQEKVKADLEYCYEAESGTVFSVTWDKEQALAALRALNHPIEKIGRLTLPPLEHSKDVAQVAEFYNLTLPKPKRGEPDYRACSIVGEVYALPDLRGKVVLTNGIKAILIVSQSAPYHWCDIMWNNFIPDDLNEVPEDMELPVRKEKKDGRLEKVLEEFIA